MDMFRTHQGYLEMTTMSGIMCDEKYCQMIGCNNLMKYQIKYTQIENSQVGFYVYVCEKHYLEHEKQLIQMR